MSTSGGSSGGGSPANPVLRQFPFAFDTPNLHSGAPLYVPTPGDVLLDSWIEVDQAFDGVTPKADIGFFTTANGYQGLNALLGTPLDMTIEDADAPTTLLNGFQWLLFTNRTGKSLATNSGGGRTAPGLFSGAYPLCVVVSQNGAPAQPAQILADAAVAVPLTVVVGVNDEFAWTDDTGTQTFTVAPGVYATAAAAMAAMLGAIGSALGHAFRTIIGTAAETGGFIALQTIKTGPSQAVDALGFGVHDVAAQLGFTANPDVPSFGADGGVAPGSTKGQATLYVVTATPL